jgi:hypothetical protein
MRDTAAIESRHSHTGSAIAMLAMLAAFLAPTPLSAQDSAQSVVAFHSEEVRKGKIAESGDLRLHVLLPPSYASSAPRRYPVVYCFHGYGDPGAQLISVGRYVLSAAWKAGSCPEFIMIGVEGTNSLGGSFYADSPATGNWESLVTKEVVPYVDATYRTVAESRARGLAGFSMGGFGAWSIGLGNPDAFSWVWACCPGALAPDGLAKALPTWDSGFMRSYGAAFAPDLSLERPYARLPIYKDGKFADEEVARLWYSGFGGIEGKLSDYLAKPARLRSVRFDISDRDYYAWIPAGTRYIAEAMKAAGIEVAVDASWTSGHSISPGIMEKSFEPYFAAAFKGIGGP